MADRALAAGMAALRGSKLEEAEIHLVEAAAVANAEGDALLEGRSVSVLMSTPSTEACYPLSPPLPLPAWQHWVSLRSKERSCCGYSFL
jgi:hypothetical protein